MTEAVIVSAVRTPVGQYMGGGSGMFWPTTWRHWSWTQPWNGSAWNRTEWTMWSWDSRIRMARTWTFLVPTLLGGNGYH